MTYDEAIQKAEAIVQELAAAQAISMEVYNQKATEAKRLLDFCEECLKDTTKL